MNWPLEVFKAVMGLGGFAGVVLTLWLSGRATRRAALKQADDEQRREERDMATLRAAILASLRALETMIEGEIGYLQDEKMEGTWVPLLDFFETYRANLDKVGRLEEDQVQALAHAYSAITSMPATSRGRAALRPASRYSARSPRSKAMNTSGRRRISWAT